MRTHLKVESDIDSGTIDRVYSKVFRSNYEGPGFAILSFNKNIGSRHLRESMLKLKRGLSEKCQNKFGEELDYYWLMRFDQQENTKFHRDNAPTDSYLMLGYEPTAIESRLLFADYQQFIADQGISIDEYYERYNPMFTASEEHLNPYAKEVQDFDKSTYKIALINNSDLESDKTLGVLHKALMLTKDPSQPRVVNSMMLYLKPADEPYRLSKEDEIHFAETDEVHQ